jgi:hypothetical protein
MTSGGVKVSGRLEELVLSIQSRILGFVSSKLGPPARNEQIDPVAAVLLRTGVSTVSEQTPLQG